MVTDQFGCNALYLFDEKEEHSVFGVIKRARKLPEDLQQNLRKEKTGHPMLNIIGSRKDAWIDKISQHSTS